MNQPSNKRDWVGPVLQPGPVTEGVVAAIQELNPAAEVIDRGGYLRVLSPYRCRVTRALIERHIGQSFQFPGDLECIMSSFKGKFSVSNEEACWEFARG